MIQDYVVGQLALFAWREGKRLAPGSRDAMLGIAEVISHRVKGGQFDGDWLKVLANVGVHSVDNLADMYTMDQPEVWDPTWRWLIEKCDSVFNGSHQSLVATGKISFNGELRSAPAYFYADLNNITRPWFLEKIIRDPSNHPRVSECQPLTFFS